jgi:hypothetical protein
MNYREIWDENMGNNENYYDERRSFIHCHPW